MGVIGGESEAVSLAASRGTSPAIEAQKIRKSYRGRRALGSIDLQVAPATVLGLLGPNGAGKTTLIRILSTVLPPDAGSFRVAGHHDHEAAAIRRRVGVLPESPGYPRTQTSAEWLTYHARLYGSSRREAHAKAAELLAEVGLSERAESLIGSLSRGMRQRLGIARSLVNRPSVLFLDEPTLGLDPLGQRQILDLVTRVARQRGVTVVLSTHLLAEVEQVCDHVVILNRGLVVAQGTVDEIVVEAAAPREAMVQVPPELVASATAALTARRVTSDVLPVDGHPGQLRVSLPTDRPVSELAAAALRCLLDTGVPVLGFSLEGGRLSDAFLAVTGGSGDG
ncbi:MAG TPA: ABC transporter ATP-binding protein [Nocardioidaceae bacterium]